MAVTFQAGVNPPGGVWQDSNGHKAGTAIYASRNVAFHFFLTSNTLALSSSILVLTSLTYKFPYYLELWAATLGMFATYASAVFAVSPDESVRFGAVFGAAAVPFAFSHRNLHAVDHRRLQALQFHRRHLADQGVFYFDVHKTAKERRRDSQLGYYTCLPCRALVQLASRLLYHAKVPPIVVVDD
ncbi:unnamed protein product [Fraxinus pennsylvanica]|uniref:PGG domain-containing protein n=1 Tax=Fraxinus pennsylvanica TaxID=56036 RepID=A0AAD2A532_9LAMI|nr:unnamed protein product [Fraxinus pennsylvanica]